MTHIKNSKQLSKNTYNTIGKMITINCVSMETLKSKADIFKKHTVSTLVWGVN